MLSDAGNDFVRSQASRCAWLVADPGARKASEPRRAFVAGRRLAPTSFLARIKIIRTKNEVSGKTFKADSEMLS
jgi:hypothetical protein